MATCGERQHGFNVSGTMPKANVYNTANRLNNADYDPAGNQLNVNGSGASYDAENRMAQLAELNSLGGGQMTYYYDGEGRRVEKVVNGAAPTVYVYDAQGQLAAEYTATAAALCQTCYVSADHLGSTRMVTDKAGTLVARHDYLPFGEEIVNAAGRTLLWGASDAINQKFTGKERDAESGLDDFGPRYYASTLGRFMSPDLPVDQHPADPQSWNLYSYVRNNPLNLTDPTGDYACGTYVSAEQCTAFGNMLTQGQSILDKAKAAGTIDSDQYKAGTKALGAYGTLNDGNGVTVNVGATGGFPGNTIAEGGGDKTAANPTGQNIQVTLNGKLFDQGSSPGLLGAIAHEGSHVEDAEAWAKAGFTAAANPTNFKTEFAAYGVTIAMAQAQGATVLSGTKPGGNTSMMF